ncbi:hypothetical protein [Bifidobacterium sp. SO1]|uniref:hypothetical protein n=1 Tax=Bifidobacterium sp. SO1 TaxID=2809029 RepID=UPI001BDC206D|nr:hypothetical protein [Bifidobacterium sp. SO1]MBT1162862.1 hypothetical protein [Bifidobacterium sp. SO1]
MTTEELNTLIEQKLDELEKIQPSEGDYLDRPTRRHAMEAVLQVLHTDEEKRDYIKNAKLGGLFQASMF